MKIILTDHFRTVVEHCEEVIDADNKALAGDPRGHLDFDDHQLLRWCIEATADARWCPPAGVEAGPAFVVEDRPDIDVDVQVRTLYDNDGRAEGLISETVLTVRDGAPETTGTVIHHYLGWLDVPDLTPATATAEPVTLIDQLVAFAELIAAAVTDKLEHDRKFWAA
ncbi:hypothetical protein ACFQNE_14135 [Gordonia phosphorivorans]|uniref:Polyketide cyclase n=1 Tax=Gordonia phosphorivorans TaxID=1056982 RepID=A0ABV6H7J9_9ACTN